MWADIAAWFQSPGGARVLQTAIVPALAILVAGVLAALIGRAAARAVLLRADREQAAAAVAGLVEAARAAGDAESRGDRRRAARLRTEADVRVRLLPLKGADRAADWAASRTDALPGSGDAAPAVAELRDALVAWVGHPARAKRLFADRPVPPAQGSARDAEANSEGAAEPSGEGGAEVPAWRRTRSGERLQQQAAAAEPREQTAPVRIPRSHRAEPAPIDEVQQLEQVEAHQASLLGRPAEQRAEAREQPDREEQAKETATAARTGTAQRRTPEWLDDYDDEAHVTQNLDLRTPPPVSASTLRDRSATGDIVPRP